jgi:uroporphyrinogen decarboxylase
MEVSIANELRRVDAVADPSLSPLILIPEDIATKHGPIFPPSFLEAYHFPNVQRLTEAWHNRGYKVVYHSDGNYEDIIPQLMATGVDGFYCLETGCGMDIIRLKKRWPEMTWAGGLDGVDLMEKGSPERVAQEVRRQIRETDALRTGGLFVATSSEINPTIPVENFLAMVAAVAECVNPEL